MKQEEFTRRVEAALSLCDEDIDVVELFGFILLFQTVLRNFKRYVPINPREVPLPKKVKKGFNRWFKGDGRPPI